MKMIEPTKKPKKLTAYQECFEFWSARHLEVLKVPYLPNHGRDGKHMNPVITTYGLPASLELIGYFWDEQKVHEEGGESWIGRVTPAIYKFVDKIPLILKSYSLASYGGPNAP